MSEPTAAEKIATRRAFLVGPHGRPNTDPNETWVGMRILGEGGEGYAGLWVRQDDTGRIAEQLVVKQAVLTAEFEASWTNLDDWNLRYDVPEHALGYTHLRISDGDTIPREANINLLLRGAENIVGFQGYAKRPELSAYRIYLDYCPYGTLHEYILATRVSPEGYIPERFIWHVFQNLARAAFQMCHPPRTSSVFRDADQIVHLDLNSDNVFLDSPDANEPPWPKPKVGDFGSSQHTWKDDPNNPGNLDTRKMTIQFCPMETYVEWGDSPPDPLRKKLSPHNIYQIGMVIRQMMTLERPEQPNFKNVKERRVTIHPVMLPDGTRMKYSKTLRSLVAACLRYDQDKRISADRLRSRLNKLPASRFTFHQRNRQVIPRHERDASSRLQQLPADMYKVGLAVPAPQLPTATYFQH